MQNVILVINAGSSSIKFKVFTNDTLTVLGSGQCEKIGNPLGIFTLKVNKDEFKQEIAIPDHKFGIELMIKELMKHHIINDLKQIKGIGHRIVMGGKKYPDSVLVTPTVLQDLKDYSVLAPLHNPPETKTIEEFQKILPNVPNVTVFDTSFHTTIAPVNHYAISHELASKYQIYRYGFHGTSYRYIVQKMQKILNKKDVNLVVAHLGNGASISAIKNGKSIDTSMGLTPLEGLVMGTRTGNIDPAVVTYLIRQGFKPEEVDNILNKESGLKGMCGTNDLREIMVKVENGDHNAELAVRMFIKRVAKYLVSFVNELKGKVDAIVFTGGIGEYSCYSVHSILHSIHLFKTDVNDEKMWSSFADYKIVSGPKATYPIYIIHTDEELMIAQDVKKITKC
ncbi:MAG: acetate kinase [Mycoplasma sp.]